MNSSNPKPFQITKWLQFELLRRLAMEIGNCQPKTQYFDRGTCGPQNLSPNKYMWHKAYKIELT